MVTADGFEAGELKVVVGGQVDEEHGGRHRAQRVAVGVEHRHAEHAGLLRALEGGQHGEHGMCERCDRVVGPGIGQEVGIRCR